MRTAFWAQVPEQLTQEPFLQGNLFQDYNYAQEVGLVKQFDMLEGHLLLHVEEQGEASKDSTQSLQMPKYLE